MNYHQCKNDMDRLISSPEDIKQECKNDIREWLQVARKVRPLKKVNSDSHNSWVL